MFNALIEGLVDRPTAPDFNEVCRGKLRPDNYGTEWCLTDVLRLENPMRQRVIDCLLGVNGPKYDASRRSPVSVRMRTADGQPFKLERPRPVGPPGPDGMYSGRQVQTVTVATMPAEFEAPIGSDVAELSAVWLLNQHGYHCKLRGDERHRWQQRIVRKWDKGQRVIGDASTVDNWRLVECAWERMYPDLAPSGEENAEGEEGQEGRQEVSSAAPTGPGALPPARRPRGRPRKASGEATA